MATLFAPDIEIARHHFFKHVAVAHFGANDFASVGAEGFIEAEVAHYRRNRSEEHTSELQSPCNLVCRLLLEKKNNDCRSGPVDQHTARGVALLSDPLPGFSAHALCRATALPSVCILNRYYRFVFLFLSVACN